METLAYSHLALTYETREDSSPPVPGEGGDRSKFLSYWGLSLLGVTTALNLLGTPETAFATLRQGDRSSQVKSVQLHLKQLGYFSARATGYFGPITKTSVLRFQQVHGLTPDGVVGQETQVKLQTQVAQNPAAEVIYLGEGSQGPAVRSLQQRLRSLGYYRGEITGNYDAATREAVMRFQQAQQLKPDGVVGPRTFAALGQTASTAANPNSQPPQATYLGEGNQGTRVRSLQQRLQRLGYYQSPITGNFDSATKDAVMRFQLDLGLKPDGVVGPRTFEALGSATPIASSPQPDPAPPSQTTQASANPEDLTQERVRELQQRLSELGFYEGQIDGLWGANTQTALEKAQRFYGVSQEDIINGQ